MHVLHIFFGLIKPHSLPLVLIQLSSPSTKDLHTKAYSLYLGFMLLRLWQTTSVTRWLDYLCNIWPFAIMKIYPIA